MPFTIGIDYGSNSVRALVVDPLLTGLLGSAHANDFSGECLLTRRLAAQEIERD